MTEPSDKTITAACLPAGFGGHTSADYFPVPLLKFSHLKGNLGWEITEIATGEKSSPFMSLLWGCVVFANPNQCCPYLIFSTSSSNLSSLAMRVLSSHPCGPRVSSLTVA